MTELKIFSKKYDINVFKTNLVDICSSLCDEINGYARQFKLEIKTVQWEAVKIPGVCTVSVIFETPKEIEKTLSGINDILKEQALTALPK